MHVCMYIYKAQELDSHATIYIYIDIYVFMQIYVCRYADFLAGVWREDAAAIAM